MSTQTSQSLISIIMPTYNRADYIIETIHSIQAQTYTHWELLVMDDGSDDKTEELIAALNDSRIQFIKLGRIAINGKVKNEGMRRAKGAFIAFMDSDDLWHAEKLQRQIDAFTAHPDAGYCLTGGYNFIKEAEPYELYYPQSMGEKYGNLFIDYCSGRVSAFTQSLMFRTNCIAKSGYFDESMRFTDYAFIGNLAYHFKGIILYEHLLFRRFHELNDNDSNWQAGYDHFFNTINTYVSNQWLPATIAKPILYNGLLSRAAQHMSRRNKTEARKDFISAWKLYPYKPGIIKKLLHTLL